jgi:hypothetical protein
MPRAGGNGFLRLSLVTPAGLFETRHSGGEAHPKRAVRYPALTRTAERWRDFIMRLIEWPLRPQKPAGGKRISPSLGDRVRLVVPKGIGF